MANGDEVCALKSVIDRLTENYTTLSQHCQERITPESPK